MPPPSIVSNVVNFRHSAQLPGVVKVRFFVFNNPSGGDKTFRLRDLDGSNDTIFTLRSFGNAWLNTVIPGGTFPLGVWLTSSSGTGGAYAFLE